MQATYYLSEINMAGTDFVFANTELTNEPILLKICLCMQTIVCQGNSVNGIPIR